MTKTKRRLKHRMASIRFMKYYFMGKTVLLDEYYQRGTLLTKLEMSKRPLRTEVLNFLLSLFNGETKYLEIGVRNPEHNFEHIAASEKYSVDPGVEFTANPVDFKLTSDEFFEKLASGEIMSPEIKFDLIFVDGLHLADQADRDIENSLRYIKDDGFIVIHDCNPPTEWHTREAFRYFNSPAGPAWSGTTWKAFMKRRFESGLNSCCVDSDWGIGILSKTQLIGNSIPKRNQFFEFSDLDNNRKERLNLVSFDELRQKFM